MPVGAERVRADFNRQVVGDLRVKQFQQRQVSLFQGSLQIGERRTQLRFGQFIGQNSIVGALDFDTQFLYRGHFVQVETKFDVTTVVDETIVAVFVAIVQIDVVAYARIENLVFVTSKSRAGLDEVFACDLLRNEFTGLGVHIRSRGLFRRVGHGIVRGRITGCRWRCAHFIVTLGYHFEAASLCQDQRKLDDYID